MQILTANQVHFVAGGNDGCDLSQVNDLAWYLNRAIEIGTFVGANYAIYNHTQTCLAVAESVAMVTGGSIIIFVMGLGVGIMIDNTALYFGFSAPSAATA